MPVREWRSSLELRLTEQDGGSAPERAEGQRGHFALPMPIRNRSPSGIDVSGILRPGGRPEQIWQWSSPWPGRAPGSPRRARARPARNAWSSSAPHGSAPAPGSATRNGAGMLSIWLSCGAARPSALTSSGASKRGPGVDQAASRSSSRPAPLAAAAKARRAWSAVAAPLLAAAQISTALRQARPRTGHSRSIAAAISTDVTA